MTGCRFCRRCARDPLRTKAPLRHQGFIILPRLHAWHRRTYAHNIRRSLHRYVTHQAHRMPSAPPHARSQRVSVPAFPIVADRAHRAGSSVSMYPVPCACSTIEFLVSMMAPDLHPGLRQAREQHDLQHLEWTVIRIQVKQQPLWTQSIITLVCMFSRRLDLGRIRKDIDTQEQPGKPSEHSQLAVSKNSQSRSVLFMDVTDLCGYSRDLYVNRHAYAVFSTCEVSQGSRAVQLVHSSALPQSRDTPSHSDMRKVPD
jgi:hypothetical protein